MKNEQLIFFSFDCNQSFSVITHVLMTIPDRKRKDQLGKRNCSRNIGRPCTEEDEFTSIVKN